MWVWSTPQKLVTHFCGGGGGPSKTKIPSVRRSHAECECFMCIQIESSDLREIHYLHSRMFQPILVLQVESGHRDVSIYSRCGHNTDIKAE